MENTLMPAKKNVIALLFGILIRPKATFDYLKNNHKRSWWLPAILVLLLILVPIVVAARASPITPAPMPMEPGITGPEVIIIERGMEPGMGMPPEAATSSPFNILKLLSAGFGTAGAWLLWGGALYLASVFLGRSSSFGQMFRLAVWTWLPYGIRGLVQTIYILLSGTLIVNAGLSGFVLDRSTPPLLPPGPGQLALASILGRVDLYLIWHLLLVSVGLMAFTNLKRKKALLAAVAIWINLALLGVIPAIFGGIFQGVIG